VFAPDGLSGILQRLARGKAAGPRGGSVAARAAH